MPVNYSSLVRSKEGKMVECKVIDQAYVQQCAAKKRHIYKGQWWKMGVTSINNHLREKGDEAMD
jgi:hypothetical protein